MKPPNDLLANALPRPFRRRNAARQAGSVSWSRAERKHCFPTLYTLYMFYTAKSTLLDPAVPKLQPLVQKAKEPKRYFVSDSCFDAIVDDIAVRNILYLHKTLASASYLEKVPSIDKEVPLRRIGDFVPCTAKLVEEKRLPNRPAVCSNRKRMHDICIVAVYLVRAREVPKTRRL